MPLGYIAIQHGNPVKLLNNGFHDEAIQDKILALLNQCGVCISPYDGTFLTPHDLAIAKSCLQSIIEQGKRHPNEWPLLPEEMVGYLKRMKAYHSMSIMPRECMTMDCGNLLTIINTVENQKMDGVNFIGD